MERPVGVFEKPPFARRTIELARAIAESRAFSVIGEGTPWPPWNLARVATGSANISTAGGAFLEFLEGRTLRRGSPDGGALMRFRSRCNWKMQGTIAEGRALAASIAMASSGPRGRRRDLSTVHALAAVNEVLSGNSAAPRRSELSLGAAGAHTGEISLPCSGSGLPLRAGRDSERRREIGETDEQINARSRPRLHASPDPLRRRDGDERGKADVHDDRGPARAGLASRRPTRSLGSSRLRAGVGDRTGSTPPPPRRRGPRVSFVVLSELHRKDVVAPSGSFRRER